MAALVQSKESRRAKRHNVLWKGAITYGVGRPPVMCVIRDFSPNGAQLVVNDSREIPDKFLLRICDSAKMYRCQTVWREPKALGVRFTGTYPRWNQG